MILLRHVLSSIPIHTLSVFDVPMVVVDRINRILANFLWGDNEGSPKRHWVSWDMITNTCEEGGLGIRKFGDIMKALRMKFAWRIQNSDSIWAKFMKAKHGIMAEYTSEIKGTARWKKLQHAWINLKDHIQWTVGKGDVLFWFDNWSHMGALAEITDTEISDPNLKLCDVFSKDGYIYTFGLPDDILTALLRINISLSDKEDSMHWDPESDGLFRVKSAWDICRKKEEVKWWGKGIWDSALPSKISFFLWKVFWHRLPTDDMLMRMQISIPSKCVCCVSSPHCESISHLFFEGEWACGVWAWFCSKFQVAHMEGGKTDGWLRFLFNKRIKESFATRLRRLMAAATLWEIWKARCSAKLGGKTVGLSHIIFNLNLWIKDFVPLLKGLKYKGAVERSILGSLNIEGVEPVSDKSFAVHWCRPMAGCFKLNVDGASRGNPGHSGGGGIIRNHRGEMIKAFSNYYGVCTNMVAEFRALEEGLFLAIELGLELSELVVESDSKVLVEMLKKSKCDQWQLLMHWKEVLGLVDQTLFIQHQFREANSIADSLANEGINTLTFHRYEKREDLPTKARGALLLEKAGMPYIRVKHG